MPPSQLKQTTMAPETRRLLQVSLPSRQGDDADDRRRVDGLVDTLMGRKAEKRFHYIRDNAPTVMVTLDI
jgi:topoisomerase-4 subunit B